MLSKVTLALAALMCASPALGQFERCHTNIMTPHHFLDMEKFAGQWYPISIHYARADQAAIPNFVCMEANIAPAGPAEHFTINEQYLELANGEIGAPVQKVFQFVNGNSTGFVPAPLPSKWVLAEDFVKVGESTIVASDEDSWALQYLCTLDSNGVMEEKMTILSRNRFLDETVHNVLDEIVYSIGFRPENGYKIIQTGCSA